MAIAAASVWAIAVVGWLVSPIINLLLRKMVSRLGFDASHKLLELEIRIIPELKGTKRALCQQAMLAVKQATTMHIKFKKKFGPVVLTKMVEFGRMEAMLIHALEDAEDIFRNQQEIRLYRSRCWHGLYRCSASCIARFKSSCIARFKSIRSAQLLLRAWKISYGGSEDLPAVSDGPVPVIAPSDSLWWWPSCWCSSFNFFRNCYMSIFYWLVHAIEAAHTYRNWSYDVVGITGYQENASMLDFLLITISRRNLKKRIEKIESTVSDVKESLLVLSVARKRASQFLSDSNDNASEEDTNESDENASEEDSNEYDGNASEEDSNESEETLMNMMGMHQKKTPMNMMGVHQRKTPMNLMGVHQKKTLMNLMGLHQKNTLITNESDWSASEEDSNEYDGNASEEDSNESDETLMNMMGMHQKKTPMNMMGVHQRKTPMNLMGVHQKKTLMNLMGLHQKNTLITNESDWSASEEDSNEYDGNASEENSNESDGSASEEDSNESDGTASEEHSNQSGGIISVLAQNSDDSDDSDEIASEDSLTLDFSEEGYELKQQRDLNKVFYNLEIYGLEKVKSTDEALEANLAAKEQLIKLTLDWGDVDDGTRCSPEVEAEILEVLCPPVGLKTLYIGGYKGSRYPDWMVGKQNGSTKDLQELFFDKDLQELVLGGWSQLGPGPELEAFPHLRLLELVSCSWDALPDNMEGLTSLKRLEILYCDNIRSLPTLPQSLVEFILIDCDYELMEFCQTVGHPYWQKIEHIPNKIFNVNFNSFPASDDSQEINASSWFNNEPC